MYLHVGPEIKTITPYYGRERFFLLSLGQKQGFSHFVLHVKHRHRGLEVKRPFNLYWWAKLNFGQEPSFLEASVPREGVF